jgi:hypothetical protein
MLTITRSNEPNGPTDIFVPPLPAWRQNIAAVVLAAASLGALVVLWQDVSSIAKTGLTWTNGAVAFKSLFFAALPVLFCVLLLYERRAIHGFRVNAETLHAVLRSTAGEITGNWARSEIRSVEAILGPRLATGRHDTKLRLKFTDDKTIELMAGHPIDDIRKVAATICERMEICAGSTHGNPGEMR